jgi:hypothetical protein
MVITFKYTRELGFLQRHIVNSVEILKFVNNFSHTFTAIMKFFFKQFLKKTLLFLFPVELIAKNILMTSK